MGRLNLMIATENLVSSLLDLCFFRLRWSFFSPPFLFCCVPPSISDVPAFFQCALRSNRSGELLAISTDDPEKFFEGVKGGSGM